MSPVARAAVAALDAFGAVTYETAAVLLGMWARGSELTEADRDLVLLHYGPADDPTGQRAGRVVTDADVHRMPAGGEGWAPPGRPRLVPRQHDERGTHQASNPGGAR